MEKGYPAVRGPLAVGVRLDENVYVNMRDGVKLAVDIYRPEADGSYPAILSISPYIKELQQQPPILSHSIEAGATAFFVPEGYIHIIASVRGTGFSQGQFNLLDTKEQQDGYDLVEWVAKQSWCDGNVGMLGDSYFAWSQYYTATQQPPHLKCIAPWDGGTDVYRDLCYQGGIFFSSFMSMWGVDTIRQCIWPGPVQGKFPPANFFADLAGYVEDGPYYWERSSSVKLSKIKVPVLNMVVGHSNLHSRGQLYGYSKIKSPQKLLVMPPTPHSHILFLQSQPVNEHILRWFDYWLKGIDTGIMDEPPVAIFDAATQEWRYENEYPLARTEWTEFYLRSNPVGTAMEPPYGLISLEPTGDEEPDKYMTPDCLELVASGKPVLGYATPPLDTDVRVCGPLSAVLYGSSTTRDTMWFVRVGDIAPDNTMSLLTRGNLKASYREIDETKSRPGQPYHPFRNPVLPEVGKVYEYQIEITPIFHTFKAGHKIWMQIASDDFDYQMRLHTIPTSEMLPVPAENAIYHDSAHPSHLLLPVIPDAPIIKPVSSPVSQIKWPLRLK